MSTNPRSHRLVNGMIHQSGAANTHPVDVKKPADATRSRQRLGFSYLLLLVWLWFEYGRPANPLGIPLLISLVLLVGWLRSGDKRWTSQDSLFVALLVVMAAGIPLAVNTFSALWTTYGMAATLVCICMPLPSLVTSVRKIRIWIYTFVVVALYVAVYAVFNGGYGPSGAGGGQDENYVAAMMGMAIPFAYFSIFAEKSRVAKVLLALSIGVLCAATVVDLNVSRGGFLGLCAVFLYCVARSPRKWIGLLLVAVIAVGVLQLAGPSYWDEIATINDVHEGTADMRLDIWQIGMRMWLAHPVLGVGPGNFRWLVGVYQSPEQAEKYGRDLGGSIIAHSLFVELLAELGIAGALVVGWLLWRTWTGLRQVKRSGAGRATGRTEAGDLFHLRCYADAVVGSILACLVNGVFLSLLYYSYLWLLIALGSAITQVFRSVRAHRAA